MSGLVSPLYEDMADTIEHILTAGQTGSGKSVILNGIINSILYRDPEKHGLILLDPKRVELSPFKNTEHCIGIAKTSEEISEILDQIRDLIERRIAIMDNQGVKFYQGKKITVVIDEFADLMLKGSKHDKDQLQSICEIARATNVQVIAATQCPLREVIPTRIRCNFGIIIGLHTENAQDSRNIIRQAGCEKLPKYGKAYIKYPGKELIKTDVPMIPDEEINRIIAFREKKV